MESFDLQRYKHFNVLLLPPYQLTSTLVKKDKDKDKKQKVIPNST